jgi:hypothetical protein
MWGFCRRHRLQCGALTFRRLPERILAAAVKAHGTGPFTENIDDCPYERESSQVLRWKLSPAVDLIRFGLPEILKERLLPPIAFGLFQ